MLSGLRDELVVLYTMPHVMVLMTALGLMSPTKLQICYLTLLSRYALHIIVLSILYDLTHTLTLTHE